MRNGHRHPVSPLDRLARDMHAVGQLDASRLDACERLAAELGDDLLAALNAELDRLDAGALPLCSRPRRVA